MKIALQLSGQPRGFRVAYDYLHKNFLKYFDVDVFFHTWKQDVYSIETIREYYNPVASIDAVPLSKEEAETINMLYTNTPDAKSWPPSATLSSFESIWEANNLRVRHEIETGKPYDYVMRTRFDFALNVDILVNFNRFKPLMDMGSIIVPSDRGTSNPFFSNDQWSFANGQATTEYCSTYLHIPSFYAKGTSFIGENLLAENYVRMRGNHRIAFLDMEHPFFPGPYNGTPHSLVRSDIELWKEQ